MPTPTTRITPCPTPFTDHIYKTAHGVDVPLRIWPTPGAKGWLLWFHGGGFTCVRVASNPTSDSSSAGKHLIPNGWVIPAFRSRGYTVVSAAYRLTPEVGLRDILQDTQDALAWCRANLRDVDNVDAYVVGGDSAGGTLSTLAGHMFDPTPRAVLDLYGVVDLTDAYFHPRPETRDEKATRAAFFNSYGATDDEIRRALACRDPKAAATVSPWTWEMPPAMSDADRAVFWGVPATPATAADRLRMDVMSTMNRDRLMFATLLRRETLGDDDEYLCELAKYSALSLLDSAATYPPAFFLHGRADRTVPVEQSLRMAAKLNEMGVEVGERYHPTGGHSFENTIEVRTGQWCRADAPYHPVGSRSHSLTLTLTPRTQMTLDGTSILCPSWTLSTGTLQQRQQHRCRLHVHVCIVSPGAALRPCNARCNS
jgi:acetyl esterase/lipase